MLCGKCGKEIQNGLQYCPLCGCETGYKPKIVNTGKKLGILSIIFSVDITILGLILGIIGLIKGIKTKDRLSIILNSLGIAISVAFTIIYVVRVVSFFKALTSVVS